MTWTRPKSWSTGETVTVWNMNTHVTDNMLALRKLQDHAVHLSMTGDQSIPSGQFSRVRFDVVDWQVGTEIWTGGPNLLAPVAGFYELSMSLYWERVTGGTRIAAYAKNELAPNFNLSSLEHNNVGGFNDGQCGFDTVQMTTADTLQVVAFQGTGDSLYLFGGQAPNTHCSWRLIGEAS